MPKFLEQKLKNRYGANSAIPYKVMNAIGAMRGNKETPKGAQMEAKHEAKVAGLHPKMQERAGMVREAHEHLRQAIPGFARLPKEQKMSAVQHHVNLRLGKVK